MHNEIQDFRNFWNMEIQSFVQNNVITHYNKQKIQEQ